MTCHRITAFREAPKPTIVAEVIWLGSTSWPSRLTPGTPNLSNMLFSRARIVQQEGLAHASVRRVAAEAGIGASTLRHYFPTQRDLFRAVVLELAPDPISDRRIRDRSIPALTRLTECVMQFLPPDDASAMLADFVDSLATAFGADPKPEMAAAYAEQTRLARARIVGWLRLLADEGHAHGDLVAHAQTIGILVDGLALQLVTDPSFTLPDARAAAERLLVATVLG